MKKWTVGELQAIRAAWRFMFGFGSLGIIATVWIFILSLSLTPEQLASDIHKNDRRNCGIALVVAIALIVSGWKLRSYLRKCEQASGKSSKPFGLIP
jgi:hypothetical protein